MKISLEELKARSKECGNFPRLVRIAKEAKSPTATFEIASKEGFVEPEAKAARYLAIIKRDYGKKVFEQAVDEIEKESEATVTYYALRPFIQTAVRLDYLHKRARFSESIKSITLSPYGSDYADVVEDLLEHYEKMNQDEKERLFETISRGGKNTARAYIREAKQFVGNMRANLSVEPYCLEKTVRVLIAYVRTIAKMADIPDIWLDCTDGVYDFCRSREHSKAEATEKV